MSMHYFVYQTKNLVNGKTYVGVHRTNNANDTYIGHGIYRQSDADRMIRNGCSSLFVRAVNKYGYSNFNREILSFFDSYDEAIEEEKWIVDNDWVSSDDNYNTCLGGYGKTTPLTKDHINTLRDITSKEYVVVNTHTGEVFFVKNLSQFERERYKEFNHSPELKRLSSRLNSVSRGLSQMYKEKWWACLREEWTGEVILKNINTSSKKRKVQLIDDSGNVINTFNSAAHAGRELNVDNSQICKVCRGECESTKNMRFRYAT